MNKDNKECLCNGDWQFQDLISKDALEVSDIAYIIDEIGNTVISSPDGWNIPQSVKYDVWGIFDETPEEAQEIKTELANDIATMCPDLVESGCGDITCIDCLTKKLYNLGWRKGYVKPKEADINEDGKKRI
jgi:hypothetical protein